MKIFLRVLVLAAVLAVVGLVVLGLSFTTLIKTGVERIGTRVLGVPVTVEDADLSFLPGWTTVRVSLKHLTIANPAGYETAHAFSFPNVQIQIDWRSLLTDTVVVEDVWLAEPGITLERVKLRSNLGDIRNIVTRNRHADEDDERDDEHEDDEDDDTRLHIKKLTVKDATINVSLIGGATGVVRLPLPDFEVHDIGKPSRGASLREASARIFEAMYGAILDAVTKSGTVFPGDVGQLGQAARDLGKTVEKVGRELLKGLLKH
ncbi:MAG: AsmA family protein [Nitrospira sp.]|nr:AsmA family protein [Nitrospira sp.]